MNIIRKLQSKNMQEFEMLPRLCFTHTAIQNTALAFLNIHTDNMHLSWKCSSNVASMENHRDWFVMRRHAQPGEDPAITIRGEISVIFGSQIT